METLISFALMSATAILLISYWGGLCAAIQLWKRRGFDTAEFFLLWLVPFYGLWLICKNNAWNDKQAWGEDNAKSLDYLRAIANGQVQDICPLSQRSCRHNLLIPAR